MSNLKQYQMFIGGEWVDAASGESFESFTPPEFGDHLNHGHTDNTRA